MSTDISTLNTSNFAELSQAMGMEADTKTKKQTSTLARLKIDHSGVMGETEIKGKKKKVEVVDAGSFCLKLPDDTKLYDANPKIQLFQQKFMYKRYLTSGGPEGKGMFVKTEMANDLKGDLRDNTGGFNCGKPSGWIEDYNSLPQDQKDLIKSIKRVRVLFGHITLTAPVNEKGESATLDKVTTPIPFIYEVDNKEAFKIMGGPIAEMLKQKYLLPQKVLTLGTEERSIASGAKYYVPSVELDSGVVELKHPEDEDTFKDFNEWIKGYNSYIANAYADASKDQDKETVDEFVDVEAA